MTIKTFIRSNVVAIAVILTIIPMIIYVSAIALFFSILRVSLEWPDIVYNKIYNRNNNDNNDNE